MFSKISGVHNIFVVSVISGDSVFANKSVIYLLADNNLFSKETIPASKQPPPVELLYRFIEEISQLYGQYNYDFSMNSIDVMNVHAFLPQKVHGILLF